MARQSLDQWIREILTDEELAKTHGKVTRLALVHIAGRDIEVYTLKIAGKQWDPKELAALFRRKAEEHATELAGTQTYNILVFFEERGESQTRRAFVVQGGAGNLEESQYVTEAPDAKGIVGQCMRHNEAYAKITLQHTGAMVDSCTRLMDKFGAMMERQMSENREMFELLRESAMAQVQRDSEARTKEFEQQRASDMRRQLMGLIPPLVNEFTGRKVFPQSTEDTALIEKLAESIGERELALLQGVLRPELAALVTRRISKHLENKNKAHADALAVLSKASIEDAELSSAAE